MLQDFACPIALVFAAIPFVAAFIVIALLRGGFSLADEGDV